MPEADTLHRTAHTLNCVLGEQQHARAGENASVGCPCFNSNLKFKLEHQISPRGRGGAVPEKNEGWVDAATPATLDKTAKPHAGR